MNLETLKKEKAVKFLVNDSKNIIYKGISNEWLIENPKGQVFVNLLPNIDFDDYPKHTSVVYKKLAFKSLDDILLEDVCKNIESYAAKYQASVVSRINIILEMLNSNTTKNYVGHISNIYDILGDMVNKLDLISDVIHNKK